MPWKNTSLQQQQRLALARAVLFEKQSISSLSRDLNISRKTLYKWVGRYREFGSRGLGDRSRRRLGQPHAISRQTINRITQLRCAHPTWGPKKLHVILLREGTAGPPPSQRSISRWLQRLGLSTPPKHRARPGPILPCNDLILPQRPNDVWTVDFKGWFHTTNGQRCEPLTVRDLYSRMVLCIQVVSHRSAPALRAIFINLFRHFGMPAAIRVDNGSPFASCAPYGCSALSLWWMRLGITVDFTRRGCPQDNGSHEQFHRVYKNETLRPPASSPRAQQRRSQRWLAYYNCDRPHEALGQKTPALLYRKSRRRYPFKRKAFEYPSTWKIFRVTAKGYIRWQKRVRLLSRILANQRVALKPISLDSSEVYLDRILLGTLHRHDLCGMRPVVLQPPQTVTHVMARNL